MNIKQYLNLSTEENKKDIDDKNNIEEIESQSLPLIATEDNQNLCSFLTKNVSELNEKDYKKNVVAKIIFFSFLLFVGLCDTNILSSSFNINDSYNSNNSSINANMKNSSKKRIIIEIDTSGSYVNEAGPSKFSRGLKVLLPFDAGNCHFIDGGRILPKSAKKRSDYFYLPWPRYSETLYDEWSKYKRTNNLILGPNFVPNFWNSFPNKAYWKERRFREILTSIKGLVVHSDRVREHLLQKSNTTELNSKVMLVSACTNLKPDIINPFENRTNDIILFEKFPDSNRKKEAAKLFNLFNTKKKVTRLVYGNYTYKQMTELAYNSKYIIYFSFYDTGAIGLKEIQNYGVFAFSHQKDLVINNETSFYIPELEEKNDMRRAFNKIMEIINLLEKKNPKSEFIAKTNQEITKCENAFEQFCKGIG